MSNMKSPNYPKDLYSLNQSNDGNYDNCPSYKCLVGFSLRIHSFFVEATGDSGGFKSKVCS